MKLHKHLTKYLYERDTIFATLWVFAFIVILGSLPINLYFVNPIKLGLKDFDFNDMAYAQLGKAKNTPVDHNIVIVNNGYLNREEIAMVVDKIEAKKPKVVALDINFNGPQDPAMDSTLSVTLALYPNLLTARKVVVDEHDRPVSFAGDYFKPGGGFGLVNFFQDSLSTFRYYNSFEKGPDGEEIPALSTAVVKAYNPEAYERLEKRHHEHLTINYERRPAQYQVIQPDDLMNDLVEDSVFTGKIVLVGYVSDNPNDIEDKKFTPMNPRFAGKSVPDMNGVFVHANIISMVLENNYIKTLPSWVNWLVAVVLCWLHMSFFIRYYLENHIWFHLVAKIAQVASAVFFVFVSLQVFDRFSIKLDMKYSILVIIMAVDVIYFYEAFAVWLHKKFHYHTVFHQKHH